MSAAKNLPQCFTKQWTTWDVCCGLMALLLVPLLYLQSIYLWEKEHLQFFPLAFAAAGWFLYKEATPGCFPSARRQWIALGLAGLLTMLIAVALFLGSPWLAHLGIVFLIFVWPLGRFGGLSVLRIAGICGLILVTVPLPLGLDQRMVQQLQSMSSVVCCRLMDCAQIVHLRRGNIIEISAKPLFVEEACSGVDSQYALMAVAGVLLLQSNSRFLVSLLTIVTVPLWAILGNLLRIFLIVLGLEWYGVDLSVGVSHTILGLVVFAIAAGAHWSSVQFLKYLEMGWLHEHIDSAPRSHISDLDERKIIPPFQNRWLAALPCLLLLLAPGGISAVIAHHTRLVPSISAQDAQYFPGKEDFPQSLGTQYLNGFERVARERLNLLGQLSNTWVYSGAAGKQLVSLDYPFRGWHPLWDCYINAGWTRHAASKIEIDEQGNALAFPYFEIHFTNPQGDFGVLFFSLFDELGQPYDFDGVISTHENSSRLSANIVSWLTRKPVPREPLTFQFQLLNVSSEKATPEQISTCRNMYLLLRDVAFNQSMPAVERLRGR